MSFSVREKESVVATMPRSRGAEIENATGLFVVFLKDAEVCGLADIAINFLCMPYELVGVVKRIYIFGKTKFVPIHRVLPSDKQATEHLESVSEPPHNTALGGIIHHMSEKRLREQLRDLARLRHLGIRTEVTYWELDQRRERKSHKQIRRGALSQVERFIFFHEIQHRVTLIH